MKINKDGTVHWLKDSVVEISLCHHGDPNLYYAKVLTSGTWPNLKVLDDKYPELLEGRPQDCPYVVWRELNEAETKALFPEGNDVSAKTYVVNPLPGGVVRVFDKRDGTLIDEFPSMDEAQDWIDQYECPECGLPKTEPSPGCSALHFGEEEPVFTAF